MTASLQQIAKALAEQVRANVQAGVNVVWYELDEEEDASPPAPRIWIAVEELAYFTTMGANGTADVSGAIRFEVAEPGTNVAENASISVLAFLNVQGVASIAQAVMSDRTLGGVVGDCVALTGRRTGKYTGEVPFEIILSKTGANV